MKFRIGQLTLYAHKIERGNNGSNPPWRGYCWGSDWPTYQFVRAPAYYCLDLSWLCYFVNIYWDRPNE